jgi:DNA damage-inducible protein 1
LDHRYEGVAVGVGTGKISGRVHSVPVKLGNQFLPCAFTVLEDNTGPEVILGLDTLRRLHAVIDMKQDALIIDAEIIPFLKGSEIPKEAFGSGKH